MVAVAVAMECPYPPFPSPISRTSGDLWSLVLPNEAKAKARAKAKAKYYDYDYAKDKTLAMTLLDLPRGKNNN